VSEGEQQELRRMGSTDEAEKSEKIGMVRAITFTVFSDEITVCANAVLPKVYT
jgi:hypothetical protein